MEKKHWRLKEILRAVVLFCVGCLGGVAYLATREHAKKLSQEKKGSMDYYDRLG